jgi:DNA replication and repair protein RecF
MPHLHKLSLQNFRNHAHHSWDFTPGVTVVVAANGAGKTSILEALQVLSTGESFRADQVADMISFNQELARVTAHVKDDQMTELDDDEELTLEVLLTRGTVQGKRTQSRLFSVNQIRRRRADFIGKLPLVIFRPEDLRLMEGSPGRRRKYLDQPLSLVYPEYAAASRNYDQVLLRRNRLLGQIKDGDAPRSTLNYWTEQLLKSGQILQNYRVKYLQFCHQVEAELPFTVQYLPSLMTPERMQEYANKELAAGHTLIGPHKDDFEVLLPMASSGPEPQSVHRFGSRGQQRLGVLWLKVCELEYLERQLKDKPLLLLDDIMSELDVEVREHISRLLGQYQSLVTTIDEHIVTELQQLYPDLKIIELSRPITWYTLPQ